MSQAAVEQVLGRLLTDPQFRDQFFADATSVLQHYPLNACELEALQQARHTLAEESLEQQADRLNPFICRADLRSVGGPAKR